MNGVLTLITTALSSGIAAAVFSSALTEGRERWDLRRKKIEEIYKLAKSAQTYIDNRVLAILTHLDGRINYQGYINHLNTNLSAPDNVSLRMNIVLYEPDLLMPLNDFVISTGKYANMVDVYAVQNLATDAERSLLSERATAVRAEIALNANVLMHAIEQRGREIASEPGQVGRWYRILRTRARAWAKSLGQGAGI